MVTVGCAPENERPVEEVTLLVRLVIVKDCVPETVWALVLKVYMPLPEVKPEELSLVNPPRKVNAGLLLVVHTPPELIVTAPTKRLVPVALSSFKVPVIEVVLLAVTSNELSCKVPSEIVRAPFVIIPAPSVLVPVPEEVIALKAIAIAAECKVASPLPEKTTVEVPKVNTPPEVMVNKVPVVPDKVIVEALAVTVPDEPIVSVVPDNARLVPLLVFKVPLTVMVTSTAESTSMVTVWLRATITVSPTAGTFAQSQVPAVFQLPVSKEVQVTGGAVNIQPLPAVVVA